MFDNRVIVIALIVLGSLMAIGGVTLLIMKKMKVRETVFTVTVLSTLFCGLLAAGCMVYLVSTGMINDYVGIKRYESYDFYEEGNPDNRLTVKEYYNSDGTGFEVYLKGVDGMLADIPTDHYMPFSKNECQVLWDETNITVYFTYHRSDDRYESRFFTIRRSDHKVSDCHASEKVLEEKAS